MSKLVILLSCLFIVCCATGPLYKHHEVSDLSNGGLYLFREGKFVGGANSAYITVDEKRYKLVNGTYVFVELPPGKYLVSLQSVAATEDITVDVEKQSKTYVRYEPNINFFDSGMKHNITFRQVKEIDAMKSLPTLRRSTAEVRRVEG